MGSCAIKEKKLTQLTYLELGQECIAHARQAISDDKLGDAIEAYEQAINYLKDALKDNALAKELLNQSYIDVAELYNKQQNFMEARRCYENAKKSGDQRADFKLKQLIAQTPQPNTELQPVETSCSVNNSIWLKKIFTNNPIASKLRAYKDLAEIKNTKELAGFLIQVTKGSLAYQDLQELGLAVIEAFAREQIKSQKLISEVIVLASSENDEIIRALLEWFIRPIRDGVLLDDNLLDGLAEVIRFANPALLNADDLSKIFDVIFKKLENLHQQGSEQKLLSLIESVARVLAAMADANVKELSRIEQHEPLYNSLTNLIENKDTDFDCRQAALYARQALVRVPDDETKLQSALRRIIKIGQGLNSLNTAFQQKSPAELLTAFTSFKEAFKYQVRQKPWYDDLRYAELLIECNHFTGFEVFIKQSEHRRKEGMLYGIVRLLKQCIETHFDITIRCNGLKILTQIWQEEGQLEHKTFDQVKEKVNEHTMLQDGEYSERHVNLQRYIANIFVEAARHPNQQLRETAQDQLDEIKRISNEVQQDIFNEMVPINYRKLEMHSPIEVIPSTHLLEIAQKKWQIDLTNRVSEIGRILEPLAPESIQQNIHKKILALQKSILNDKDLNDELATYIPVNGSYQRFAGTDTSTFDLETKVQELLRDDSKRVLLLLGSAGGGKSTFNRYLAKSLWEKYKDGDPIPLFISLPSLVNPETALIQEYLHNLNPSFSFNEQELEILKEKFKFIFILDGYDEINKLSNLYLKNHLENWQAKIIISCRTDYLTGMASNDTKIFMPYLAAKPLYQAFVEMSVVPFSDEQITAYITKYLIIHKDNPEKDLPWQQPKDYEEQIAKIPGLKQLIKTPFLLMVAMDVMPHIVKQYAELEEKERTTMTKARLLDEFVQQLFEREEDKLMVEDQLPKDGRDVKEDFWAFSMELAVAMHEADTNDVYYAPQGSNLFSGDRSSNPWERFFGTPADSKRAENLARARKGCNCVLRTIGKNRRTFIHATLQDYFVVRKIKLDEDKRAPTAQMAHKPFTPFYSSLVHSGFELVGSSSGTAPQQSLTKTLKVMA